MLNGIQLQYLCLVAVQAAYLTPNHEVRAETPEILAELSNRGLVVAQDGIWQLNNRGLDVGAALIKLRGEQKRSDGVGAAQPADKPIREEFGPGMKEKLRARIEQVPPIGPGISDPVVNGFLEQLAKYDQEYSYVLLMRRKGEAESVDGKMSCTAPEAIQMARAVEKATAKLCFHSLVGSL